MIVLPLAGLKVLDLSRILAGPYAAQILGDLGATVLKIENPDGDETRRWGPPFIGDNAAYYFSANRNKTSIAIDFKKPEQLAHVHELVKQADVLLENFKTGSLQKFQLDYESIKVHNPQLIYCSITGYGQSGSASHKPGFDAMIQAEAGMMSITGEPGHPSKVGVPIADLATGLYAVIAIQAALLERQKSGLGQHIDLALFDVQTSLLTNMAMNYLVSRQIPQPLGSAHPNIVPYQIFESADAPLFIAVGSDAQFARLCEVVQAIWHLDEKFKTNKARVQNREQLIPSMQTKLREKKRQEWLDLFAKKNVPAASLNNLQELSRDATVKEKDLFTTMDDGKTPCLRSPLRFSRTPIEDYKAPLLAPTQELKDFSDLQ